MATILGPSTLAVTDSPGGQWRRPGMVRAVHTIQFENGSCWDATLGGWRDDWENRGLETVRQIKKLWGMIPEPDYRAMAGE